jgi:two-component system, cell cycle response regulator
LKSFQIDLDSLLSIAAAVLDAEGVLLDANAGFLRLLPADGVPPIGSNVARYFVQPAFAALVEAADSNAPVGYRGLLTIGDSAGTMRTLRGRAWRTPTEIRVLAEYDIAELERLNESILDLNRVTAVSQHTLASANVAMKQREVQIVAVSLTDALTGVGNRRRLEQALAAEIARVQRDGGELSAIMADVDHFKRVNDEFGHGAGDKVLVHLGALLKSHTRSSDIVARFGGEEFFVLMPHASLAQAATKAEQLRAALAAEIIEPLANPVTSSFGVAALLSGEDAQSFLARIDKALYRAKADGRNRVVADPGKTILP